MASPLIQFPTGHIVAFPAGMNLDDLKAAASTAWDKLKSMGSAAWAEANRPGTPQSNEYTGGSTPQGAALPASPKPSNVPAVTPAQKEFLSGMGEEAVGQAKGAVQGGGIGAAEGAYDTVVNQIPAVVKAYSKARDSGKGFKDSVQAANDEAQRQVDARDMLKQRIKEFQEHPDAARGRLLTDVLSIVVPEAFHGAVPVEAAEAPEAAPRVSTKVVPREEPLTPTQADAETFISNLKSKGFDTEPDVEHLGGSREEAVLNSQAKNVGNTKASIASPAEINDVANHFLNKYLGQAADDAELTQRLEAKHGEVPDASGDFHYSKVTDEDGATTHTIEVTNKAGQPIGRVEATSFADQPKDWTVTKADMGSNAGNGYGFKAYRELAKAAEKNGASLTSETVEPAAQRVWQKLKDAGFNVQEAENGQFTIEPKPSFLERAKAAYANSDWSREEGAVGRKITPRRTGPTYTQEELDRQGIGKWPTEQNGATIKLEDRLPPKGTYRVDEGMGPQRVTNENTLPLSSQELQEFYKPEVSTKSITRPGFEGPNPRTSKGVWGRSNKKSPSAPMGDASNENPSIHPDARKVLVGDFKSTPRISEDFEVPESANESTKAMVKILKGDTVEGIDHLEATLRSAADNQGLFVPEDTNFGGSNPQSAVQGARGHAGEFGNIEEDLSTDYESGRTNSPSTATADEARMFIAKTLHKLENIPSAELEKMISDGEFEHLGNDFVSDVKNELTRLSAKKRGNGVKYEYVDSMEKGKKPFDISDEELRDIKRKSVADLEADTTFAGVNPKVYAHLRSELSKALSKTDLETLDTLAKRGKFSSAATKSRRISNLSKAVAGMDPELRQKLHGSAKPKSVTVHAEPADEDAPPVVDTAPSMDVNSVLGAKVGNPQMPALEGVPNSDVFVPAYTHPDVQNAMADIYAKQGFGTRDTESSFIIHGHKPDFTPILKPVKEAQVRHHETFDIAPGDTAIVHTHPNSDDPRPSQPDRDIADKHNIDIYTVTSQGVFLYRKGMKTPLQVINRDDFNKVVKGRESALKVALSKK
jgi:hypothetical protein